MKILILGGNGFIGSQIAKELLALGNEVYSASRLRAYGALPRGVTEIFYDRSASTMAPATELTATQWDACIDCSSYTSDHITQLSPSFCDKVAHYIFISAIRAHKPTPHDEIDEASPLYRNEKKIKTITSAETYSQAKAQCELQLQNIFGKRLTILRPQAITGIYDPLARLRYWVNASLTSAKIVMPGQKEALQFLNILDLAKFITALLQKAPGETYNIGGDRMTWGEFAEALNIASPIFINSETLINHEVRFYNMPFLRATADACYMKVNNQKARDAGFTCAPIEKQIQEMRAFLVNTHLAGTFSPNIAREVYSSEKLLRISKGTKTLKTT